MYGGTTAPPQAPTPVDEVRCPQVDVIDGGAALRAYSGGGVGEASALRSQISLGDLARECVLQADGNVAVKVGVEGRALIGPAGGSGKFEAPLRIVIRDGDRVYANISRRVPVTIPAGETQGRFVIVEEGMTVPASIGDNYLIEVGLGNVGPAQAQTRRRR